MSTNGSSPKIKVENALLGLSLTQTFFTDDADAIELFENIITEYDDADLLAIYAQLTAMWAITEAAAAGITPAEYIEKLRRRLLTTDTHYKTVYQKR